MSNRRIFYVDVGNLPEEKIQEIVSDLVPAVKSQRAYEEDVKQAAINFVEVLNSTKEIK
jgi:hypothetical protein